MENPHVHRCTSYVSDLSKNWAYVDTKGQETLRDSSEITKGSSNEDVLIPEVFVESLADWGAIGVAYVPVQEIGSKSRSDTNSEGDTGTYKAAAELDNVVQFYVDMPFADAYGATIYGKVGVQHATIKTLESLNSGSTYPDADLIGLTLGLGTKGDLQNNFYYKAEATYTNFEEYAADSTSTPANNVEAEIQDFALKFSIGRKF